MRLIRSTSPEKYQVGDSQSNCGAGTRIQSSAIRIDTTIANVHTYQRLVITHSTMLFAYCSPRYEWTSGRYEILTCSNVARRGPPPKAQRRAPVRSRGPEFMALGYRLIRVGFAAERTLPGPAGLRRTASPPAVVLAPAILVGLTMALPLAYLLLRSAGAGGEAWTFCLTLVPSIH